MHAKIIEAGADRIPRIPVTLLTGFLGSGKTTVLSHVVRQPELSDALVIINEFGEMALDHMLVAHSTENLVMEMSSGCVCCSIRGDLVKTLRDITWRFSRNGQRQFRRVLIETTGLADPTPIIQTLITHPQISLKYRLDGVVATVDLATGQQALDQHPEAVRQAALADVLLLTKADLATDAQSSLLLHRLEAINPAARRYSVRHGEIQPGILLNLGIAASGISLVNVGHWLNEESYSRPRGLGRYQPLADQGSRVTAYAHKSSSRADVSHHDDRIRAFCFVIEQPVAEETLSEWLQILRGFVGQNILRVKGILNVMGNVRPIVIHGVKHVLHPYATLPAWPTEDRRSRLVFITQDVGRDVIEEAFHDFRPRS